MGQRFTDRRMKLYVAGSHRHYAQMMPNLLNWVILDKGKCWDSYSSTMEHMGFQTEYALTFLWILQVSHATNPKGSTVFADDPLRLDKTNMV